MISQIEKGLFAQLFNRCGYVLDFQQQILMLLLFLVLGYSCAPNIIFQR